MVDERYEGLEPYENIFDVMGADWEAIVNQRDTEKEVNFIESALPKKGTVLDLCCGTGRHAVILSKEGWNMMGLDLSKNLLAIAKQNMKKEQAGFPIVRADMRFFPFVKQVFDAVICMFTSFGYLPSEVEDLKSFREIERTLRNEGRFVLDVMNVDHVVKVFREREWAEYEPFYMLEKRSLNLQRHRLISEWTIISKDTRKVKTLHHSVRLYTFQKLKQLLSRARLKVKEVYGGYDKKEFNPDNPRMIMIAQKID